MGTVGKGALGALVVGVLLVGCDDSDVAGITQEQYNSVVPGQLTRQQAVERFGEPATGDEVEFQDLPEGVDESALKRNCIYYNREGTIPSLFQFCFDGEGGLAAKRIFTNATVK